MIDIIVIGGGAAGMTAALYAKRSGKSVKIFEKESFGGQIANSPKVENFPSIKEISGLELSNNMFEQIMDLGVEFECEDVLEVKKENDCFIVTTDYNTYLTKAVIIAAGVKHRTIDVPFEEELVGKGVSYCATCDGAFFKGKDVAVIGSGNTAIQDMIYLADICNHVYGIVRGDSYKGEVTELEEAKSKGNVTLLFNSVVTELIGNDSLEKIKVNNEKEIDVSGVFVAIGNSVPVETTNV